MSPRFDPARPAALTPLQLDLLQVLWERGEATVPEATEALRSTRGLAPTTVATLLARLVRRGLVARRRGPDRVFAYRAVVGREEARRAQVDALAKHLFEGDVSGLLRHLVAREDVTPGDLERVRALLERRARDQGKERTP